MSRDLMEMKGGEVLISRRRAIRAKRTACANARRQRSTQRAQGKVRRLEQSEQGGELPEM